MVNSCGDEHSSGGLSVWSVVDRFTLSLLQQKGRSDELKSFEEMEKLTSELEEPTVPQNQGEDKTPGDALGEFNKPVFPKANLCSKKISLGEKIFESCCEIAHKYFFLLYF